MKLNNVSPTSVFYGILAVSGVLLLGPYIGIRFFRTTLPEQQVQSPTLLSRPSQGRERAPQKNPHSELQSIEDLLAR